MSGLTGSKDPIENENVGRFNRLVAEFDPKKLAAEKTRKLRVIRDVEFGIIHFGILSHQELRKLKEIVDKAGVNGKNRDWLQGELILHAMLKKAYPDLIFDDVRAFPLEDTMRLVKLFIDFMQAERQSVTGLPGSQKIGR